MDYSSNISKSISVIIPAYNAEATILKCLKSLNEQILSPLEIIVVDDNSQDKTVEIAKDWAIVISNERNKGAGGARNTGAYKASGDILAFIDSDCIAPPDWLQKILIALKEEGVGAVAGNYSGNEGKSFISHFAFLELVRRRKNFPDYVHTGLSNNFAIYRDLFKKIEGFPEFFDGATAEDLIFSYKTNLVTRIRWLKYNGVRHHFLESIHSYLKQQYQFGRDTVVAFNKFPVLAKVKSHHGRLIYIETIITCLMICSIIKPWPWLLAGFILLWLINLPLLYDIFTFGGFKMALYAFLFIPLKDINLVRSLIGGLIKVTFNKLKKSERRHNI